MYKSQNNETEVVLSYFHNRPDKKSVLSIGENDGITYSNSYDLVQMGWEGFLLEPSPKAFEKLKKLYEGTEKKVNLYNFGIANETGKFKFNESGSYNHVGEDVALLSSLVDSEMVRWGETVRFEPIEAEFKTFQDFISEIKNPSFEYITIDAEGYDYDILRQIDLRAVHCACLCIEHNGINSLMEQYREYANRYHLKEISLNPENIIFAL